MHPLKFGAIALVGMTGLMLGVLTLAARQANEPSATSSPIGARPTPVATRPAGPRYAMRQGSSFGYEAELSPDDRAAGIGAKGLVMIDYAGLVGGQYSFQTTNPVTGNLIVFKCAEPCRFMNVINYDHRGPEVYPVAPDSVMAAFVSDARAGYLKARR